MTDREKQRIFNVLVKKLGGRIEITNEEVENAPLTSSIQETDKGYEIIVQ